MTKEIEKDIGSKIGRVLEVDKRAMQANQAKFLRIRVEVPIDKPLRKGGYVKNEEGGRYWVDFRNERLPTFCYICGILRHDEKHCQVSPMEQLSGRQYGEWLKAGGVIKNGGEKDKIKVQLEAKKVSSPSMVVDGGAGEENGAVRGRSTTLVVDGGAIEEGGTVVMMDTAPLDMVKGTVMSTHREQGRQIKWEDKVPEVFNMGLERIARDKQIGSRIGVVRNELHRNKGGQVVVNKKCGPVIREAKMLSPITPKEKEGISKERNCGLVIREVGVLSPLKLTGNEGTSEERDRQLQGPGRMFKQAARGRIKNIAREKGKAQGVEKSEQAQEVSKKRKGNDEMCLFLMVELRNVYVRRNMKGV
nr:hypothetical protein CFP56_49609 [Quercus suber]